MAFLGITCLLILQICFVNQLYSGHCSSAGPWQGMGLRWAICWGLGKMETDNKQDKKQKGEFLRVVRTCDRSKPALGEKE